MAREIILRTWCDPCLVEEKQVEGQELPPLTLIPGRKPRVLALCEVHRKEFYEPLVELLAEHGQAVDSDGHPIPGTRGPYKKKVTPLAGEGAFPCPAEGCNYVGGTKNRLQSHARSVHDVTLAELEGEPLPHACPTCEKKFSSPQGLAVHLSRTHQQTLEQAEAAAAS